MFSEHDTVPLPLDGTEGLLIVRSKDIRLYLVLLTTVEWLQTNIVCNTVFDLPGVIIESGTTVIVH